MIYTYFNWSGNVKSAELLRIQIFNWLHKIPYNKGIQVF